MSPNTKIPAIVKRDTGFHLMEPGAILWWGWPRRQASFRPRERNGRQWNG